MKRKLVLLVLAAALFLGATGTALADIRLDFDIPVLLAAGANVSDLTNSSTVDFSLSNLHIPLPYVELAYQFGGDTLRGGVGVRSYTLLVEFLGWPMGYVELELDRLILRAELGGFAFFLLGVYNDFFVNDYTLKVMLPDFQISYAFAPWFRAGVGVILLAPFGNLNNAGYVIYVNARFALTWK
jgi:hypothetical protein